MAGCNPYDEIRPVAQGGSSFEPVEEKGGFWKKWILPGTDNSWRQAHEIPACFTPRQKIDFIRELDKVGCLDGGNFAIKLLAKLRENAIDIVNSVWFEAWLKKADEIGLEGDFVKILGKIEKRDTLELGEILTLVQVLYLYLESDLKIIDSPWLSLYTKEVDGIKISSEGIWLVGAKSLRDEILAQTDSWLQAKQIMVLGAGVRGQEIIWLSTKRSGSEDCLAEDSCWKMLSKTCSAEMGLEDSCFGAYGYNQGGYNIGVYA